MREVSMLMVGACTISGYRLPATLGLPVLIGRIFRGSGDRVLRIKAENHIENLGQLLRQQQAGNFPGPYEVIVMQSMIGRETVPDLGVAAKLDQTGSLGDMYRICRRSLDTPTWNRLINGLRSAFGRRKSSGSQYERLLADCLEHFRLASPTVKIIVLGQTPPFSTAREPFSGICEQNRQLLQQLACRYDFDFLDLHSVLSPYPATEIFQQDGLHYTAAGQRILAKAVADRLKSLGVMER